MMTTSDMAAANAAAAERLTFDERFTAGGEAACLSAAVLVPRRPMAADDACRLLSALGVLVSCPCCTARHTPDAFRAEGRRFGVDSKCPECGSENISATARWEGR